jgi:hypothetical protein
MDYSSIGFDSTWEDPVLAKKHAGRALLHGLIFSWFAINLLVAIIRTIATNPGNIPEEREWDMSTDQSDVEYEAADNLATE